MAKNKNRKQAGTQSRSSQPEQAQDQSHRPASEPHASRRHGKPDQAPEA